MSSRGKGGLVMNLSIIRTVVEVSKSKSFQDAAFSLNYTPAVVSKHVARAEEELGVKLFFRGNKASAVSMTPECEAIIEDLDQICRSWERAENSLEYVRNSARSNTVRIGLGMRTWSDLEDEIIADFIQHSPDITVELSHGYAGDLLNSMSQGRLDGVFLTTMGDLSEQNLSTLSANSSDYSFIRVAENSRMYMAISERHELAKKDEAEFWEFRDFTIAFNSDKLISGKLQKLTPFLELSRKYGIKLNYSYLPTTDASAYRIAKNTDLAIPVPANNIKYDGIKYVRLKDWEIPFVTYFVFINGHNTPAFARFCRSVEACAGAEK